MMRPRDVVLGLAGALVLLIGPAPADFASLFAHREPECVSGCGHTNAWWDRPVLVAHADELPAPANTRGPTPSIQPRRWQRGPAAPHRRLPG
jgi:hypothetical protein